MTDIQFYHLSQPLERVLPKLLEKSLAAGFMVRVKCGSEEKAEALNALLWTYDQDAFLPHGTSKDGYSESQPVYLTATDEDPNAASLLVVTDGSEMAPCASVKRVLDMVDARDETALGQAQSRLQKYRDMGLNVSCVRQTASGWEKVAA